MTLLPKVTTTTAIAVSAAVMFLIVSVCNGCGRAEAVRLYQQQLALRHTDSLTITAQAARLESQQSRIRQDSAVITGYQQDLSGVAVLAGKIQSIVNKHTATVQPLAGER